MNLHESFSLYRFLLPRRVRLHESEGRREREKENKKGVGSDL